MRWHDLCLVVHRLFIYRFLQPSIVELEQPGSRMASSSLRIDSWPNRVDHSDYAQRVSRVAVATP